MSQASTAYMINGFDPSKVADLEPGLQSIITRRSHTLGPAYRLFYDRPVQFVRGKGVFLYDDQGNEYLDAYNNVPSVGHCHPHVIDAVTRQLGRLNTHTRYASEPILNYASRLLDTYPAEIGNVMFTCTGSEAVDLALRTARFYTKAQGVIITDYAYHGTTAAVAAISPTLGPNVPVGEDVRTVPAPRPRTDGRDPGDVFAEDVEQAIKDLERHGHGFAGLIVDSIFSTDGVLVDPPGFLAKAVDVVHAAGGVYIADEVQPGFGRTGATMWGFQRHGVVPDIVVMGKPMGNGMPIAGMAARPEVLEPFGTHVRYFNTFGGNSVCIAAANAVLDVIESENLQQNSRDVGAYLLEGVRRIAENRPNMGDVRGAGLFLGADFVTTDTDRRPDPQTALAVINGMRDRHILISGTGAAANILKIRPLLPFTRDNADTFLNALEDTVDAVVTRR